VVRYLVPVPKSKHPTISLASAAPMQELCGMPFAAISS
jgi:hypothetical protein